MLQIYLKSAIITAALSATTACTTLNSPIAGQGDIDTPEVDPANITLSRADIEGAMIAEITEGIRGVQMLRLEHYKAAEEAGKDKLKEEINKFCYRSGTGTFSGKYQLDSSSKGDISFGIQLASDPDRSTTKPGFVFSNSASATHEIKSSFNIQPNIGPLADTMNNGLGTQDSVLDTKGLIKSAIIEEYLNAYKRMTDNADSLDNADSQEDLIPLRVTSSSVDVNTSFTITQKETGSFEINIVPGSDVIATIGPSISGEKDLKNIFNLNLKFQTLVPKTSDSRRVHACYRGLDQTTELCVEADFSGAQLAKFQESTGITLRSSQGENSQSGQLDFCNLEPFSNPRTLIGNFPEAPQPLIIDELLSDGQEEQDAQAGEERQMFIEEEPDNTFTLDLPN